MVHQAAVPYCDRERLEGITQIVNVPAKPPWLNGAEAVALAGDASNRRYARLRARNGKSAIRAEYPAEAARRLRHDLDVLRWFEERGLRVPRMYLVSLDPPWAVFEDFGVDDAEAELKRTPTGERVARAATLLDPLVRLATISPEELPPFNEPLDEARLRHELEGFSQWYLGARCGQALTSGIRSWLNSLAWEVGHHPQRICHRDYHLNNLFFLADGSVGMIDVQDALTGPDTYDLASLIGERALPELIDARGRRRLVERWAVSVRPRAGWEERLEQTLLQRGLKVLGTFSRLEASGKTGYTGWISPLARRLIPHARRAGAPQPLIDCLIYSGVDGGAHVR